MGSGGARGVSRQSGKPKERMWRGILPGKDSANGLGFLLRSGDRLPACGDPKFPEHLDH